MDRSAFALVLAPALMLLAGAYASASVVAPAQDGNPTGTPAPESAGGREQGSGGETPPPLLPEGAPAPPSSAGGLTREDVSLETPKGADPLFEAIGWRTWWEANSEACLDLSRRTAALDRRTGDGAYGLGTGTRPQPRELAAELIEDKVAPALVAMVEERDLAPAAVREALIALGRVDARRAGPSSASSERPSARELALERLSSPQREIAEGALLALAACNRIDAVEELLEVLADSASGRHACGRSTLDSRTRAVAASALGLAASGGDEAIARRVAAALIPRLETPGALPYEVELASLVSLGLARLDPCSSHSAAAWHVCRATQLQFLSSYVGDTRRRNGLRAQAAIALARIASERDDTGSKLARELLLDMLSGRERNTPEIQQACAIALGFVADCDEDAVDRKARAALERIADKGEPLARGLALISLARVAARAGSAALDAEARDRIQKSLIERLAHASDDRKAWAALALGLHGLELERAGQPRPPELSAALARALARERSVEDASVQCLALGMVQDAACGPALLRRFEEAGEPGLRSSAAFALGWVGANEASAALADEFRAGPRRSSLFLPASLALRLLGDPLVVPGTIEMLHVELANRNTAAAAACAELLGRLRDPRAVPALSRAAGDPKSQPEVRTAAAVALAELCDPRPARFGAAWTAQTHPGLGIGDWLRWSGGVRRFDGGERR